MLAQKTAPPFRPVRTFDYPVLHPDTDIEIKNEDCAHTDVSDIFRPKDSAKDDTCTTSMAALSNWEDTVGLELSDIVVQPFINIYQDPLDEQFVKQKSTAYPRPANAKALKVPRLNSWLEQITTEEHKQQDQDLQSIQSYMVASMSAVAGQAQTLLDLNLWAVNSSHPDISCNTDMFSKSYASLMDANLLMTKAMCDTNEFRRKLIKQGMSDSLMSLLLDENKPTPEWLAGKDVGTAAAGADISGTNPKNRVPGTKLSYLTEKEQVYSESVGVEQSILGSSPKVQKHKTIGERHHVCTECGKGFKQAGHLRDHMRTHTGEKPYTCFDCSKRFTVLSNLKTHMRTHSSEKPYVCSECGKGFSQMSLLTTHITTHKRENVHVPPDKSYKSENVFTEENSETKEMVNMTSGELKTRMKKKHTFEEASASANIYEITSIKEEVKDNPNTCSECGQIFGDLDNLMAHVISHTENLDCTEESHLVENYQNYQVSEKAKWDSDSDGTVEYRPSSPEDHTMTDTDEELHVRIAKELSWASIAYTDSAKEFFSENTVVKRRNKSEQLFVGKKNPETNKRMDTAHSEKHVVVEKDLKLPNSGNFVQKLRRQLRSDTGEMPAHLSDSNDKVKILHGCVECGEEFKDASNLKVHVKTHTGKHPYLCCHCGKGFTQSGRLKTHMKTHTGARSSGKPACSDCGKRFSNPGVLKRHMMTHTGAKPHVCTLCARAFSMPDTLRIHMMTHTGEKPFLCKVCGKGFRTSGSLTTHARIHTAGNRCTECGKGFSSINMLKVHMMSHTGENPFVCTHCGKVYSNSGNLKMHMKSHTDRVAHLCTDCGKTFTTLGNLQCHIRAVHMREKPYKCTYCGKSYSMGGQLKTHIRIHTGEKPFVCEVCGKGFRASCDLTSHMRIHTGEKPFVCSDCGKQFRTSTMLKKHHAIHTGEKPFGCSVCGKRFSCRWNVNSHMKTHTGERPFACSDCGKAFSETATLRKHAIRFHTGELSSAV